MARTPPRPPVPSSEGYELVWDGKYDAHGKRRSSAPPTGLQLVLEEQYREPGASSKAGTPPSNLLIHGDNLHAAALLLPKFRAAVQLIYLDPPFGSDADYALTVADGPGGSREKSLAYRDRWGQGSSYLAFMAERLSVMRELLADSGTIFLHCDWHFHAPLRLLLDETFGSENFINEIVWYYYNKYSRGLRCLPRAHDTILVYGKTRSPALYPLRFPRAAPQRQLLRVSIGGVLRNRKGPDGKVMYRTVHDKKADDVWTIPQLQPASSEWTGYATQKHPLLLERILALASKPGDWVADFFCGSGTTLTVAQSMERRFIGCDLGDAALHISRRRLLEPAKRLPLDVYGIRPALKPKRIRNAKPSDGARVTLAKSLGLSARLNRIGDSVQISLMERAKDPLSPKRANAEPAMQMPSGDIEMWAVDPSWEPGRPFTAVWLAIRKRVFRSNHPGPLELTSPPLTTGPGGQVLVRAWDHHGRVAEICLPNPQESR